MQQTEPQNETPTQTINSTISALNNRILSQQTEIEVLKRKIDSFSQEHLRLSTENSNLKNQLTYLQSQEQMYKIREQTIIEKEEELSNLNNKYYLLQKEFSEYKNINTNKYEKDIVQVRLQNENNNYKIENAYKVEKCNDTLYYKILQLENIIKNYAEEEAKRMGQLELEHQKKMDQFKKKMLDYLKNEQSSKKNMNTQQELNSRLTILHINELVGEIDFQSKYVEDLLRENDNLKKKIMDLSNDIKIHVQVANCLGEKNKKFQSQLHSLSKPYHSISVNSSSYHPTKISTPALSPFQSNSKIGGIIPNQQNKLTKKLLSKDREIESLKMKLDTTETKLEFVNQKYANLFKLFDDALEKIYNEELDKKVKELYINVDDFKGCDFDKLDPYQKYSVLALISKYIFSFVCNDFVDSNIMKKKLSNVQQKFYFSKNPGLKNYLHNTLRSGSIDSYSTSLTNTEHLRSTNSGFLPMKTASNLTFPMKKNKLIIKDNKVRLKTFSILNS